MKYFTKQWYNKMQSQDLYILLKIDERANEFSEKFYQEIYNNAKNEYVNELSCFLDFDKYKEIFSSAIGESTMLSEEELQEQFLLCKQNMFGGLSLEDSFDYKQKNRIELLESKIPDSILDKVKDIRVLALNYASKEIYELLEEYSRNNEKYVNDKINEYVNLEKEQFENNPIEFIKESFHDCKIFEVVFMENDLTIKIDNEQGFTEKTSITFRDTNIILNENLENSWWLYNEIYKLEDKYEIHILASGVEGFRELILECRDIILK